MVLWGGCGFARAQTAAVAAAMGPPPSNVGVFPLSQVHRGLHGTAWTVFEGTVPEPMDVEILGVLHGARGPHRDLILARLHGAKPEYTGVVAGMSGSPVYIDGKLAGALSYRIGQFSKEAIAGITPIEQMLEVRDLPDQGSVQVADKGSADGLTFSAMETPLMMSGFQPEAIRLWKERVAGTGLDMVSAGGGGGSAEIEKDGTGKDGTEKDGADKNKVQVPGTAPNPSHPVGKSADDFGPIVPGSAVSLEMARGDLEIAATCTVTYVDPKRLLACGHPILQAGPVSLPMTSTEVLATLPSPLNAFKIVNTGNVIGAFTEDRDSAIGGVLGATARMIPVSIEVADRGRTVERKVEVLDLPALTAQVVLVSVYQTLLETNESTAETSYHVTGEIQVSGEAPVPVNAWGTPGETMAAQLAAALGVADGFNRMYANSTRLAPMESVRLHVETIPRDMRTELESVRLISSSIVHAGDTVEVEATLRPWQQPERNVRIPFQIPARLEPGTLRLMVGSSTALDRTMDAARPPGVASEAAVSARLRGLHAADQVYVSLLLPESQASMAGNTLDSLPLSMANTMESQRSGVEVGLHGESIVVAAQVPAGGVLNGQQMLSLRIEPGGGLR